MYAVYILAVVRLATCGHTARVYHQNHYIDAAGHTLIRNKPQRLFFFHMLAWTNVGLYIFLRSP